MDPVSSTENQDQDVEAQSSGADQDVDAQSSSAEDVDQPASAVDAALATLGLGDEDSGEAEGDQGSSPEADQDQGPVSAGEQDQAASEDESDQEQDLPAEVSEDELKAYSPNAQRRIRGLIAERNGLQGDADQFVKLNGFFDANGMSHKDAAEALVVGAQVRRAINGTGDPKTALAALDHIRSGLLQMVGEGDLPDDLRRRVDDGEMSEQAARELLQARSSTALAEHRTDQSSEANRKAEAQRQADRVKDTINDYQSEIATRDPDWPRKRELFSRITLGLVQQQGRRPRTPAEAKQLMDAAYRETNEQIAALAPPKRPVNSGPGGSRTSTTRARSEPQSSLDAAFQALDDTGA